MFVGEGSDVTDPREIPDTIFRIHLTHNGTSNFIVHAYGPNGEEELLVNGLGEYDGTRMLNSQGGEWYFEVKADGRWTMMFQRMVFLFDGSWDASGSGDFVTDLFPPAKQGPVPFLFKHDGERNFIVHLLCSGGDDLVQNEVGSVDAAAIAKFNGDRCLWDVKADGNWSIAPRE